MNIFLYDFGYGFLWNYGHLLAVVPFGILAVLGWKLGWPRWVVTISLVVTGWGVVGLLIVQLGLRFNLPLELPTERFLAQGGGRVLDGGAGSGRASLMVLLERPLARVVAVDVYEGYFGIEDNTPQRLVANAAKAKVDDRVEARIGDLRDLEFENSSFDAVVSAYVIDHLDHQGIERSLAEFNRVLRPNGELLLMVINPDGWLLVAYPFFVHHGSFGGRTNHERWRTRIESAGFAVDETGTTPGTLYVIARKTDEAVTVDAGG